MSAVQQAAVQQVSTPSPQSLDKTGAAKASSSVVQPAAKPSSRSVANPGTRRVPAPASQQPLASKKARVQPSVLIAVGVAGSALLAGALGIAIGLFRRKQHTEQGASGKKGKTSGTEGRWSHLKATSKCVPLADGSACVVRREIPADNSCLFNAVGYGMHKSKTRAPHLRNVVASQVASDKDIYSTAFLGMANEAYCHWIRQPMNWGGGIELSILSQGYGIEISAWNIESAKCHTFGEESGYKRQVMVIYNGVHYDALAICQGPKADPENDDTDYNPRTKRGKMIIAAAKKLTELTHRGSKFYKGGIRVSPPATAASAGSALKSESSGVKLRCSDCSAQLGSTAEAEQHAKVTGHKNFEQVA